MHYDKSFKENAVSLSDEIGVKKAAEQLGISYNTLAEWRRTRTRHGNNAYIGSGNKYKPASAKEQRIQELEAENKELKRANEILKDALGFFAESRKK